MTECESSQTDSDRHFIISRGPKLREVECLTRDGTACLSQGEESSLGSKYLVFPLQPGNLQMCVKMTSEVLEGGGPFASASSRVADQGRSLFPAVCYL